MRGSSQSELIVITFSVMLSAVRSFIGGILTREGSMAAVLVAIEMGDCVGEVYCSDQSRNVKMGPQRSCLVFF